jgi:hypothetical protein
MISYIKIYGPPINRAIKALEEIAINMPEVCIMNKIIESFPELTPPRITSGGDFASGPHIDYFRAVDSEATIERCNNIISRSGEQLGDYDFFFEWFKKPSSDELYDLRERIDNALSPLGCKYTISTKNR